MSYKTISLLFPFINWSTKIPISIFGKRTNYNTFSNPTRTWTKWKFPFYFQWNWCSLQQQEKCKVKRELWYIILKRSVAIAIGKWLYVSHFDSDNSIHNMFTWLNLQCQIFVQCSLFIFALNSHCIYKYVCTYRLIGACFEKILVIVMQKWIIDIAIIDKIIP